jgi:hypothetical protein
MFGEVPPFMGVDHTPSLAEVRADAVVVGMPYDGIATFRGGATRRAPQEIRKYSLLFGPPATPLPAPGRGSKHDFSRAIIRARHALFAVPSTTIAISASLGRTRGT